MLCMLALFAFVACKNDPKNSNSDSTTHDSDAEAAITQPGVLDVRPAASVTTWTKETNWTQSGKFQFRLDVEFEAGKSIDLYLKCSESFNRVAIRQAGGDNTKFKIDGAEYVPLSSIPKDDDGWYIVSVPAESVTPMDGAIAQTSWIGLGITLYVPDGNTAWEVNPPCYAAIKGLSFNGEFFDITNWDEETCVKSFYDAPAEFDVTLTLDD